MVFAPANFQANGKESPQFRSAQMVVLREALFQLAADFDRVFLHAATKRHDQIRPTYNTVGRLFLIVRIFRFASSPL